MKQLASAAAVSALMGITEPALYGVTLKLKRPVVAASVAAGIGGIVDVYKRQRLDYARERQIYWQS